MKPKIQLVDNFISRFNEHNLKFVGRRRSYDIRAYRVQDMLLPFDITLEVRRKVLAIIEIKVSGLIDLLSYIKIEKYANDNNIRYYAIGDGDLFQVYDRRNTIHRRTKINFNKFIEIIQSKEEIDVDEVKKQIASNIKNIIDNSNFKYLKEDFDSFSKQLSSELDYDDIEQVFYFRNPTDINNIENRIFRQLLKDDKSTFRTIYRYTTIESVFSMLEKNSYRMNCLVGMNDTTEINYAENYIFGTNRDYSQAHWQTVDAYNRRFISSCTLKEDDLTQWRLYSEDSKGACLAFSINPGISNSRFIIKKISYSLEKGVHPELDLIRNIISQTKELTVKDLEFRTLNTWRHFFKPYDYHIEEEVRILFIQTPDEDIKKSWVLTSSHKILNPYIEFKLNDETLPFQLIHIILGPKSPEKEINLKQFEHMIRELRKKKKTVTDKEIESKPAEYNITKLKVSISGIKNYR